MTIFKHFPFMPSRLAVLLLALAGASAALAENPAGLRLYAHTLEHREASEAMELVELVLSEAGTVELQRGGNTLVVRDRPVVVEQLQALLTEFDRPPRDVELEIHVLRAGPGRVPGDPAAWKDGGPKLNEPPAELVERLRGLLRYDSYELLARAELTPQEGEEVEYALGDDYGVSFRLGSVLAEQRLKLHGFRITQVPPHGTNKTRQLEPKELIHTNLNLWLGRVFALVLAQDGANREALMVAITCHPKKDEEKP